MSLALGQIRRDAVVAFVNAFVVAALNRQVHERDSRWVEDTLTDVVATLRTAAAVGAESPLLLQFDDDRICYDGVPLDGPSLQARSLLRRCSERGIAMLAFHAGLDAAECNRLFDLLLLRANVSAFTRENREAALSAFGVRNVGVTLRSIGDPGNRRAALDPEARALRHYQELAESLQDNHCRALRDLELTIDDAAAVVERTLADFDEPSHLLALATQDDVDRFTVGHSVRVALLALQVARRLGHGRDELVRIGSAALLHDIGKSKVPQEVLFKQGPLDEAEWRAMAQHPRLGAQILLEQKERVELTAVGAAFCHHMGAEGGYPDATVPVRPSGASRLIRVCDVFEALTSIRPYKRALTPIEAYAVMSRDPRDFDRGWLRAFVQTIGLFPDGTRLRLADGARAVVRAQTTCPDRPIVQLLTGPDDTELAAGQPDHFTVGDTCEGRVLRVAQIETQERRVDVPELGEALPAACVGHACVPDAIAKATAAQSPAR
ncbi:MAG: HD domain-containing protein [Planctomycetes bacterium]|nr:HD domain-containing protein [Planctomycetota bacterium]